MSEEWEDVESALNFMTKELNVPYSKARRLLHRYVCKGLCSWYRERAYSENFASMVITENEKKVIEEALTKFVKGKTLDEKIKRVHSYLCPGEPSQYIKNCRTHC
ncbi:MAG: hypothetical protein DRZ82_10125 [Thermoprotei archaeon]|nr:MAG: hypothetical protein DRZ82_10125 [Thermoprotei archaeon]